MPNWADGRFIKPLEKSQNPLLDKYNLREKFIVEYSGALSLYHDFTIVLEAAKKLNTLPVIFLFISSGPQVERLKDKVKREKLGNFRFLPYQPQEALKHTLPLADVGLVLQRDDYKGVNVPGKTYSYLAAGISVIAVSPSGSEVAKTIAESKCGFVITDNSASSLTEKIRLLFEQEELRKEMAVKARQVFEANYERRLITKRYAEVIGKFF